MTTATTGRHREISALTDEHERLLELLGDLECAVGTGDPVPTLLGELRARLGVHATREEGGVFTGLRNAHVDDAYVGMFERDHQQLHRLLDACSGPEWRAAAWELVRELREDIGREESDLFPAAHQFLAPAQWDAIDAATGPCQLSTAPEGIS